MPPKPTKPAKKCGPKPRIKRTDGPTATQQKIIQIAQEHPTLSTAKIGLLADCDHSHVVRTLAKYGIDKGQVESYKTHRGDILAGIQSRLVSSITEDDIKKTPLGSRVMAMGILYDKERLERGMSTANMATITADIASLRASKDDKPSGGPDGREGESDQDTA